MNGNHTRRAHFSCEDGSECVDDCLDGYVCDECTDADNPPVWWPCATAARPGLVEPSGVER